MKEDVLLTLDEIFETDHGSKTEPTASSALDDFHTFFHHDGSDDGDAAAVDADAEPDPDDGV